MANNNNNKTKDFNISKCITWGKDINGNWSGSITIKGGYKITTTSGGNARVAKAAIKSRLLEHAEDYGFDNVLEVEDN